MPLVKLDIPVHEAEQVDYYVYRGLPKPPEHLDMAPSVEVRVNYNRLDGICRLILNIYRLSVRGVATTSVAIPDMSTESLLDGINQAWWLAEDNHIWFRGHRAYAETVLMYVRMGL